MGSSRALNWKYNDPHSCRDRGRLLLLLRLREWLCLWLKWRSSGNALFLGVGYQLPAPLFARGRWDNCRGCCRGLRVWKIGSFRLGWSICLEYGWAFFFLRFRSGLWWESTRKWDGFWSMNCRKFQIFPRRHQSNWSFPGCLSSSSGTLWENWVSTHELPVTMYWKSWESTFVWICSLYFWWRYCSWGHFFRFDNPLEKYSTAKNPFFVCYFLNLNIKGVIYIVLIIENKKSH